MQQLKKKQLPPLSLRLTPEERQALEKAASGISLSAYIRKCIFGKTAKPRKVRSRVPIKDEEALAQVLALLGQTRIANNLNQIAFEANCGSLLMDEETENEINKACTHIAFMRAELIKALGLSERGAS
ncbi:MAG: hypothetical protein OCD03_09365 [Hyphomicrobiales bacterium]